jgi:hypothetical protein
MTTQFPITEPQAALLAACPRPRAVAPSASMPLMPSSSPAWVGVARLGAVAEERNGGFGYAVAGIVGNGSTSTRQDQQHKQHLTARRGPVTWRPPH